MDREAYLAYFRRMHQFFPKCKKMVMAVRNQIASSHHTLTGVLYDTQTDTLYTTKIYDIQPIIDPMGVGDAFIAAYLHANSKCTEEHGAWRPESGKRRRDYSQHDIVGRAHTEITLSDLNNLKTHRKQSTKQTKLIYLR